MKTIVNIPRKDTPWSGLEKIPDEAVIKQLRKDLGAANSYIEELEDKIKLMECEQKILTYKQLIKDMTKKIHKYKHKLHSYRKRYGQLPFDDIDLHE